MRDDDLLPNRFTTRIEACDQPEIRRSYKPCLRRDKREKLQRFGRLDRGLQLTGRIIKVGLPAAAANSQGPAEGFERECDRFKVRRVVEEQLQVAVKPPELTISARGYNPAAVIRDADGRNGDRRGLLAARLAVEIPQVEPLPRVPRQHTVGFARQCKT